MSRGVIVAAGLAVVCLGFVAVIPMAMTAAMLGGGSDSASLMSSSGAVTSCSLDSTSVSVNDLSADQVQNARTLIAVGKSIGVPPRGWVIAIATALQESGLRNLDYGDRDSLGLMQQRPSAGWGTPQQVTTPSYAARAFYGGPSSPTRNSGLLSVPGWQKMPLWQAAQSVQRSGFPFAYEAHEALATDLVHRLAGKTAGCAPLASGPWRLPVARSYTLTSGFGPRVSPTTGGADFHTGQDFAVPDRHAGPRGLQRRRQLHRLGRRLRQPGARPSRQRRRVLVRPPLRHPRAMSATASRLAASWGSRVRRATRPDRISTSRSASTTSPPTRSRGCDRRG